MPIRKRVLLAAAAALCTLAFTIALLGQSGPVALGADEKSRIEGQVARLWAIAYTATDAPVTLNLAGRKSEKMAPGTRTADELVAEIFAALPVAGSARSGVEEIVAGQIRVNAPSVPGELPGEATLSADVEPRSLEARKGKDGTLIVSSVTNVSEMYTSGVDSSSNIETVLVVDRATGVILSVDEITVADYAERETSPTRFRW